MKTEPSAKNNDEHRVSLRLVLAASELHVCARQAVYQSSQPPFNKSVCPPQQGMHKTDAAVSPEERSKPAAASLIVQEG